MNSQYLKDKKERLAYFNELFRNSLAMRKIDFELMRNQYEGDNRIVVGGQEAKPCNVVRNVTYELVESQVNSHIPVPSVTPKMATTKMERNARNITNLLKNLRDELPFERLNDEDERNTYIYGTSIYFVEWDSESNKAKLNVLAPHQIVTEPNVMDIQDMSYVFLTYSDTAINLKHKFGVTIDNTNLVDNEIQVIVCFFKDNGKISQLIFTNDVEISYLPNYYGKRIKKCKTCGEIASKCQCGSDEFDFDVIEKENLSKNFVGENTVIPKKSPLIIGGVLQEERVWNEKTNSFMMVPKLKNTKIPVYSPKLYPIVARKNISKNADFFGQSDVMAMRPQQLEINKLESRIMEKLLKAGVLPYSAETTDLRLSDEIYTRGIKLKNMQEKSLLGVLDLQTSIAQEVQQSERLYQQSKRIVGISDSFQGMPDSSATSGIAKQMLISQSSGRLNSKKVMKNSAYADLDKVLFEFYLAFSTGKKTVYSVDGDGKGRSMEFSKYDFLQMDENGKWEYIDDYLFSTDVTYDIESDKGQMWNEIRQNYTLGTYGDVSALSSKLIFWKNMLRARYPYAKENIEYLMDIQKANTEKQEQFTKAQMQASIAQNSVSGNMNRDKNDAKSIDVNRKDVVNNPINQVKDAFSTQNEPVKGGEF